MKNKLLYIGLCMFILCIGLANSSDWFNESNLIAYYSLDNSSLESSDIFKGSIGTEPDIWERGAVTYPVQGLINDSCLFANQDNYIYNESYCPLTGNHDFTGCAWVNLSGLNPSGFNIVMDWGSNANHGDFSLTLEGGDVIGIRNYGAYKLFDSSGFTDSAWHLVCAGTNGTDVADQVAYLDGVKLTQNSLNNNNTLNIGCTQHFTLGEGDQGAGADHEMVGYIDEVSLWNRTLDEDEVLLLFQGQWDGLTPMMNNGTAGDPEGDNINISMNNPVNASSFTGTTMQFNLSVNSSSNFDCDFYVNDTLNQTLTGFAAGVDVSPIANLTGLVDGTYTYYWYCSFNASQNETSETRTFYIDNVLPAMQWITPADTNTTIVSGSITSIIYITDDNLYSYEYNISYPNGTILANYSNSSLTGQTNYTINHTTTFADYRGLLTATAYACDGHTNNILERLKNPIISNYEYDFNGIKIIPLTKEDYKKVDYEKKTDRYSFDMELLSAKKKQSYYVMADEYIDILEGSGYYGHLVVDGVYWIDFESSLLQSVEVTRIADDMVLVEVKKLFETTEWYFNSIGELNCNTETAQFFAVNYTNSFSANIASDSSVTYTLNVSYNDNYVVGGITGTLDWNGTQYTATATNNSDHYILSRTITIPQVPADSNITFNWTFTINSVDYTTENYTQQIHDLAIDNCSSYTQQILNFTAHDEFNNTILSVDWDYHINFTLNGTSSSNYYVYNGTRSDVSSIQFCINPAYVNISADIYIEYYEDNYDTRHYIKQNYYLDNVSDNTSVYMITQDNSTEYVIQTYDDQDEPLQDILVEIYRWDIDEDRDILVQSELTNYEGEALMYVRWAGEQYSLQFWEDGERIESTRRYTITTSPSPFVLFNYSTNPLEQWIDLYYNTDLTLTYNGSVVSMSYTDAVDRVSDWCLSVVALNGTTFYSACSSADIGNMSYVVTERNASFVAFVNATDNTDNKVYIIQTIYFDTNTNLRDWIGASFSYITAFVVLGFMSLIALVNMNASIILSMFTLIMLGVFGVISSWGYIIGFICLGFLLLYVINHRRE